MNKFKVTSRSAVVATLVMLLLGAFLFACLYETNPHTVSKDAMLFTHANSLCVAIHDYCNEYGVLPINDATLPATLFGENPKNIVFAYADRVAVDSDGRFLDPFGRPYKLIFEGNKVSIFDSNGHVVASCEVTLRPQSPNG